MTTSFPNATGRKPMKASDIMSQPVISVYIKDSVQSVADLFVIKNISGVPVLGEDGFAIGVMTKTDLARYDKQRVEVLTKEIQTGRDKVLETQESLPKSGFQSPSEEETIEQWFNPKVHWVLPDTPLLELADKMLKHHIHHLFVKDANSKNLVGVITSFDLLGCLTSHLHESSIAR